MQLEPSKQENPVLGFKSPQATHLAITIIAVVLAMVISTMCAKYNVAPWITVLFVAGTVGGVVNNFRRMQKLSESPAASRVEGETNKLLTIQIYLSPLVGGILAMVLYCMFMSGFVQGSLFPEFKNSAAPFTNFATFAADTEPKTNADAVKSILWSFIAGFSEGLVPNFISKVASKVDMRGK